MTAASMSLPDDDATATLRTFHEEACFLWLQRCTAVQAPNYTPRQFAELDEQLAANLDGLRTQPAAARRVCDEALNDDESADGFFVAAFAAVERLDGSLDQLLERAAAAAQVLPGVMSALGYASPRRVADLLAALLADGRPVMRKLGIGASAMHRRDLGDELSVHLSSASAGVRCRALRAAGELGDASALPAVLQALRDPRPETGFWASWAAVLLGDRQDGLGTLSQVALRLGGWQPRAWKTALLAVDPAQGHELLMQGGSLPQAQRSRIVGTGCVGDVKYVPWLIDRMTDAATARIAGEAFVHITGADFNLDQLEAMPPDGFEDGPSDDPDDDDVELPEDIALPWPDVERVKAWWMAHRGEFAPDRKLFLGKPITPEHCLHVLRTGLQRQRVIAAHYRSLIQPGTVLFPTSAPAWRQQQLLEALR